MYSLLHAQVIRTQQEQIAARAIHHVDVRVVSASRSRRLRRRAVNTVAALGVCIAAATGVAISEASAHQSAPRQGTEVSMRQLQREISALNSVGFVATSCEPGGTRMKNFRTGQSLLLPL
jgi:hypothetical protein